MRIELIYGFKADRGGDLLPMFDSRWNRPSPLDEAGYWHAFGGVRYSRAVFVGFRAHRLDLDHEVIQEGLDRLQKLAQRHASDVNAFETWWAAADRDLYREAAGFPQLRWHVVVTTE